MNAQEIIDRCDIFETSRKQFRDEMNISWLINDVKKQFKFFGNEEGRANSSSECPALPNQITEKEVKNGRDEKSTRKD